MGFHMCRFVPYLRSPEGYIERVSYAIYNAPYEFLYPYIYEQPIEGWPEQKVFWATKSGPSVGIAPISSYVGEQPMPQREASMSATKQTHY